MKHFPIAIFIHSFQCNIHDENDDTYFHGAITNLFNGTARCCTFKNIKFSKEEDISQNSTQSESKEVVFQRKKGAFINYIQWNE